MYKAVRTIKKYYDRVYTDLIKDGKWALCVDNPEYDGSKVGTAFAKFGYDPLRFTIEPDHYGSFRDQHALCLGFFFNHPRGGDCYYTLKKMAVQVHKEMVEQNPSYYGYDNDAETLKWMVEEHSPLVDSRVNAMMLLALFRYAAKYPDDYITRLVGFVL